MKKLFLPLIFLLAVALLFAPSAFAQEDNTHAETEKTKDEGAPEKPKQLGEHYELGISAEVGETDVVIRWNAVPGASGYRIAVERGGRIQTLRTERSAIRLTKLVPNMEYTLRVKYVTQQTEGPWVMHALNTTGLKMDLAGLPLPSIAPGEQKYCILVVKGAQISAVFEVGEDGAYSKPVRVMICSTGKTSSRTPTGYYSALGKEMWHHWGSNNYSAYNLAFTNTLKFHSILLKGKSFENPLSSTLRDLGKPASAGCVRLQVKDARWLYENCPVGTPIEIVEGEALPALHEQLMGGN